MSGKTGTKPAFQLVITDKENTKSKTFAGTVFGPDEFGCYRLVLGPGVVIDHRVREGCYLTLKPPGWRERKGGEDDGEAPAAGGVPIT